MHVVDKIKMFAFQERTIKLINNLKGRKKVRVPRFVSQYGLPNPKATSVYIRNVLFSRIAKRSCRSPSAYVSHQGGSNVTQSPWHSSFLETYHPPLTPHYQPPLTLLLTSHDEQHTLRKVCLFGKLSAGNSLKKVFENRPAEVFKRFKRS